MTNSENSRRYVVTGAASGIGKATRAHLEAQGHHVIGIDLRGSDIDADLSTESGRQVLAPAVEHMAGGPIDAIIAVAGVSLPDPLTVRVNHFGAVATLERLRPLLAGSAAPRAAVVASFSALQDNDPDLVDLLRANDEAAAVTHAAGLVETGKGDRIYASTKRAIAEWVRTNSIVDDWAGAGIPLNAVGPGLIRTPMTDDLLSTEEGRKQLAAMVPMPLHGPADPDVIAAPLAWLTSVENTHTTGQVLFVDGGADVSIRGPRIFS